MLTLDVVKQAIKNGRQSNCIDRRDFIRLACYFPYDELLNLGFEYQGEKETWKQCDWTEENIKKQLEGDVAFGFEKALNRRGISSEMMYHVVKMWMWILEDDLQNFDDNNYAMYGLPLFKAVAVKYGFNNRIGNDTGKEGIYSSECID